MIQPEQLYKYIPKLVCQWSSLDVQKWFKINNIQINKIYSFHKQQFNGQAFIQITPKYLLENMGIQSRIIMKKIIQWIQYDREQFQQYVKQHPYQSHNISPSYLYNRNQTQYQTQNNQISKFEQQYLPIKNKQNTPIYHSIDPLQKHCQAIKPITNIQKWKKKKLLTQQSILQKKSIQKQIIKEINKSQNIIPLGANLIQSSYQIIQSMIEFKFNNRSQYLSNSGIIGRHTVNDIIIVGDSVSRRHAQIIKDKNQFYLKDTDSKFGTFIQIGKNNKNIEEDDIIAFQDFQIQILKYKFNKSNYTFDLKIRKIGQKQQIMNFYNKKQLSIGKQGKDINFPDQKIFINHARILCNISGKLQIISDDGICFRKLKKDEILNINEKDKLFRLGLTKIEIKITNNHKPINLNINEYNISQI